MKRDSAKVIGWVAMQGVQVVGELRTMRPDAEKDAEKLGEGAWVAPVRS